MTNYTRAAYGPNPNAGKDRNNAQSRGWGTGWPKCQSSKMVKVTHEDQSVNVRREIAELVATLLMVTDKLGYDVNPAGQVNQTWGFACRAIRGSSTASNHSWGLAVDINSLANPMQSTFRSNIPPAVVHAWEVCGFYWGGRYANRPDSMHFEYIGKPSDVAADLAQAKAMLAVKPPSTLPPKPGKDITLSIFCLQRASNGIPISGECLNDANQLFSIAGHFYPLVLQTTKPAWDAARNSNNTKRAAELFQYATKVVQANVGVAQDGWYGQATGDALHRKGGWITKKS
jgi:hypothetical protein